MSSDEGSDRPSECLSGTESSEDERLSPARGAKAKTGKKMKAKKGKGKQKGGKAKAKMAAKHKPRRDVSSERDSSSLEDASDSEFSALGSEASHDVASPTRPVDASRSVQPDQLLQMVQWLMQSRATSAATDGPSTSAGPAPQAPDVDLPALFAEMQGQLVAKKGVGEDIHPALAGILNPVFRNEPDYEKMTAIVQKYPRPDNVKNLTVPATNDNLHLSTGPEKLDERLITVQEWLAGTCSVLMSIINDIGSAALDSKPIRDYHVPLFDALRLAMAGFSNLHQCRKDNIWNDMGHPVSLLCNWEEPVGEKKLFDCKIKKRVNEIKEAALYSKKRKAQHQG